MEAGTGIFQYWAHEENSAWLSVWLCIALFHKLPWLTVKTPLKWVCDGTCYSVWHFQPRWVTLDCAIPLNLWRVVHWEPLCGSIDVRIWAFVILISCLFSYSNNLNSTWPNFCKQFWMPYKNIKLDVTCPFISVGLFLQWSYSRMRANCYLRALGPKRRLEPTSVGARSLLFFLPITLSQCAFKCQGSRVRLTSTLAKLPLNGRFISLNSATNSGHCITKATTKEHCSTSPKKKF